MAEPLALGLEFANTAEWHAGPSPEERLTNYRAALSWAKGAEILSEAQAERLAAQAETRPQDADAALGRIITLREAVYRIFAAVAQCRHPDEGDLDLLHAELREGLPHLRIVAMEHVAGDASGTASEEQDEECTRRTPGTDAEGRQFYWTWGDLDTDLAGFLWPVAGAAATLLTSGQVARVRMCADETCGWLFIDHSKNASRRWCDMGDCGNRAKARRYRARQKAAPAT